MKKIGGDAQPRNRTARALDAEVTQLVLLAQDLADLALDPDAGSDGDLALEILRSMRDRWVPPSTRSRKPRVRSNKGQARDTYLRRTLLELLRDGARRVVEDAVEVSGAAKWAFESFVIRAKANCHVAIELDQATMKAFENAIVAWREKRGHWKATNAAALALDAAARGGFLIGYADGLKTPGDEQWKARALKEGW